MGKSPFLTKLRFTKLPLDNVAIIENQKDNVATARVKIKANSIIVFDDGKEVITKRSIPVCHKIALRDIHRGEPVIKYGEKIGFATEDISIGDLVHIHNLEGYRGKRKLY